MLVGFAGISYLIAVVTALAIAQIRSGSAGIDFLADNGSPWFLSGAPDDDWNNDELQGELRQLKGSEFRPGRGPLTVCRHQRQPLFLGARLRFLAKTPYQGAKGAWRPS